MSPVSDPSKQERIQEFLRKSLLGDELVNTQFHLFSARSPPSARVVKPRVLCANNVLLAKSSKFFLDLLSSDTNPSDPSLIDLTDDKDVPSYAQVDEYGYGSDSDLDNCEDSVPETAEDQSATLSASPPKINAGTRSKDDDEWSDDESVSSDMFVMSPEHPSIEVPFSAHMDRSQSVASSETAVQGASSSKTSVNQTALRLRSLGSRHVLVKDTAFRTWYTLLNYLYTDRFSFLPLGSATPNAQVPELATDSLDEPRCSAKSMYRLACKVGLDQLRDEAFAYIRSNLTEHNIIRELSCSLLSTYPQLLEMELDVLYSYIASPSVVANFPTLAQRIANKELAHGADIIVGIHTKLLKEPRPLPFRPSTPVSPLDIRRPSELATTGVTTGRLAPSEDDESGSSRAKSETSRKGICSPPQPFSSILCPPLPPLSSAKASALDDESGSSYAKSKVSHKGIHSPPPTLSSLWGSIKPVSSEMASVLDDIPNLVSRKTEEKVNPKARPSQKY